MEAFVRIPLDGGGSVLVEASQGAAGGPVKAGRADDVVAVATSTLNAALVSVTEASRVILAQLKAAGPEQVEVEFGVELTAQAGAVIAKAGSASHLTVKLTWRGGGSCEAAHE